MTISRTAALLAALSLVTACGQTEQPAGSASATGSAETGSVEGTAHPGQATYQNYCFSCHTPGLSGAPKLGDAEAWAPRIAKGEQLLLQSTIDGIAPAMPARGMCFDCSDEQLAAAIDFMIQQSQ